MKLYFLTGCRPRPTRTRSASPSSPATASTIGRRHTGGRRSRSASAGSCPSRTRRSSGSARTRSPSCSARSTWCATATQAARRPAQVARPGGDARRGHRQPWRPADRAGHRAGVAGRRDVPGVGRVLRPRPLDRGDGGRGACRSTGTCTAIAPSDEVLPWDHLSRRPPQGLPVGRLAGGARRQRGRGLPLDALLRLRGVHRVRHRARRRVAASPPAGGSQGTGQDLRATVGRSVPGDAAAGAACR